MSVSERFYVEFYNRDSELLDIPQKIVALQWSYDRQGGCGQALIVLPRTEATQVSGDFEVRIIERTGQYGRNQYGSFGYGENHVYGGSTGIKIWYRGYVQIIKISDSDNKNKEIMCSGFRDKLRRLVISATYVSTEISDIVNDLMPDILNRTGIGTGEIEDTGFTPDSITFDNETADRVIQKLVELAGGYEWGVDRNKNLYFVAKSETVNHRIFKGINVQFYENEDDYEKIYNSIIIIGGGGYTLTVQNSESIANFGQRDLIVQNASVTTSAVGTQLGNSILSNSAIPERRGKAVMRFGRRLIETNIPLGLFTIMDGEVLTKFGTSILYGSGIKYGGGFPYQIENIRYTLQGEEVITELELGMSLTNVSEKIAQLEFVLDQQRQNI